MDILALVIAAFFTAVSPLAIAWKKNPHWSTALKTGIPIVVSVVIAIGYLSYVGGIASGTDIFTTILTVYGVQQLVYTTILKQLSEKLEWRGHEESEAGVPTEDSTGQTIRYADGQVYPVDKDPYRDRPLF